MSSPESYWTPSPYATYGCFPARNVVRWNPDAGAWFTGYKKEQARRFRAVLCGNSTQEKEDKYLGPLKDARSQSAPQAKRKESIASSRALFKKLSVSYLLDECHVDKYEDLASVNISGKKVEDPTSEENFKSFSNVFRVQASDNLLSVETFNKFPSLEELELQANQISQLNISPGMFVQLKVLDLSHNKINSDHISSLGVIPNLEKLLLTGNDLENLPENLSGSYAIRDEQTSYHAHISERFPKLIELHLDRNMISDQGIFAVLAGLKSLKRLNLACNKLSYIPQLLAVPRTITDIFDSRLTASRNSIDQKQKEQSQKRDVQGGFTKEQSPPLLSETENNNVSNEAKDLRKKELESSSNFQKSEPSDTRPLMQKENKLNNNGFEEGIVASEQSLHLNAVNTSAELEEFDLMGEMPKDRRDTLTDRSTFGMIFNPNTEHIIPFEKLETLDVSCNSFTEEQALLAVAYWKSLKEIIIWGNPLTESKKGDPPMLQYSLSVLCGIAIERKKPCNKGDKLAVAPIISPIVKTNRVKDVLPPIRKPNQLMIEFQKKENDWLLKQGDSVPLLKRAELLRGNIDMPLPDNKNNVPGNLKYITELDTSKYSPLISEPRTDGKSASGVDSNGVFLTQVDEEGLPYKEVNSHEPNKTELPDMGNQPSILDVDEYYDDETPLPTTLRGAVVALKHALDHPLVFNERDPGDRLPTTGSDKKLPKSNPMSSPKSRSKRSELLTALDRIRTDSRTVEENLDTVLQNYSDDEKLRRQFPEVKALMKEVQAKYDEVRMTSLQTMVETQRIADSTRLELRKREKSGNSPSQRKMANKTSPIGQVRNKKSQEKQREATQANNVDQKLSHIKNLVEKRI